MMRKCHLNTCPVGIATQNAELRTLFTGKPDYVVNLFSFLAEELREIMAELGFRTVNEMVGQSNYLEPARALAKRKFNSIDLTPLLYMEKTNLETALYNQQTQDHDIDHVVDRELIYRAQSALQSGEPVQAHFTINNQNRAVGTMLSHEISKKCGAPGLPENTIHFKFTGTAGQSFGAFAAHGLTLELEGDANDYVGKGLSGGRLIIYPHSSATFTANENIIIGNVAFYGATNGEAYLNGLAGERFCVRNSGARVVVEGVGDHGCEYMTGGIALILGPTGRNFAAGMSGGVAYVYDQDFSFTSNCNMEMILLDTLDQEDQDVIKNMISNHLQYTGSPVAKNLISNWEEVQNRFIKVIPIDYKKVLEKRKEVLAIKKTNG